MDHVFKGFGLGEAYGLAGAEAQNSNQTIMVDGATGEYTTPVALNMWEAPNGARLLVSISFGCPGCNFPLHVPATQAGVTLEDTNSGQPVVAMRMPIACPAHWEHVNDFGQTSGRQVKCGWRACIRDNRFHHPQCGVSNFRQPADTYCGCSQLRGV